MKRNDGHCPREAYGKRVRVKLRNGETSRSSWAADGKQGCRWTLVGHLFDIVAWEIAE